MSLRRSEGVPNDQWEDTPHAPRGTRKNPQRVIEAMLHNARVEHRVAKAGTYKDSIEAIVAWARVEAFEECLRVIAGNTKPEV